MSDDQRYTFTCPLCGYELAREVTRVGDLKHVFHCGNCEQTWTEDPLVVHVPTTFDDEGYAIDSAPIVMYGGGGGGGSRATVSRTLVVDGALARHMMRQHLTLSGITYSEVRDDNMSQIRSTFTIEASDDAFAEAEAYARKVME